MEGAKNHSEEAQEVVQQLKREIAELRDQLRSQQELSETTAREKEQLTAALRKSEESQEVIQQLKQENAELRDQLRCQQAISEKTAREKEEALRKEPRRSSGSDLQASGSASQCQSEASGEEPSRKQSAVPGTSRRSESGRDPSALDVEAIARDRAEAAEHPRGWGALHSAVNDGDAERLRELLARGFDPRVRDRGGRMPLHCALDWMKRAAAEVLLEEDPGNDIPGAGGLTPLIYAACTGWVDIVRKLVAAGARLRHRDTYGETALHNAIFFGKEDTAQLLAELDSSNNVPDKYGNRPLHLAASAGYARVVKTLLSSGICPHVKKEDGEYPLYKAASKGHDNVVKIILAVYAWKGIQIDQVDLFRPSAHWLPPLPAHRIEHCMGLLSECEAEIRRMKETRIGGSTVTFYDIATRHVNSVATYLRNEGVRNELLCDRVELGFPTYADLIAQSVRRAEERRALVDEFHDCFSILARKLPPLPLSCMEIILRYLADRDVENVIEASKSC